MCLNTTGTSRTSRVSDGSDTDVWQVTEPVGGGPQNGDVIPSFLGHVAHRLWQGQHRPCLKSLKAVKALVQFRKWNLDDQVMQAVAETGLSHLPSLMYKELDATLIAAFVERWQPDTNTFHMPFGEMTITLHDVHHILGIPIEGETIFRPSGDGAQAKAACVGILGVSRADLETMWIKGGLSAKDFLEHGSKLEGELAGPAWLMMALGLTLFLGKARSHIPGALAMEMLLGLKAVGEMSWGSAALAYLYCQLGKASRADCRELAGCLTLLQAWIYEYFPSLAPHPRYASQPGVPRAQAWRPIPSPYLPEKAATAQLLIQRRADLDRLRHDQV